MRKTIGKRKKRGYMNYKKNIRIAFTDFYQTFDKKNNFIMNILKSHYNVELINAKSNDEKKSIQYVFYSSFGTDFFSYPGVRIFVTGENMCPDFSLCDYALGFEHMSFEDRFIRYPIYLWDVYRKEYNQAITPKREKSGYHPEKRKFCSIVVSNDYLVEPSRKEIFYKLSEYKRVDSGGRAFNNIGKPEGVEDKEMFIRDYKFNIAFENSLYSGYTTEKIIQAFAAGTVPIYAGDPRITEMFDVNAFINANHLTMDQIVRVVSEIDRDDKAYLNMLYSPILLQPDYAEKKDEELKRWLFHIIDQDLSEARRRPLYGKIPAHEDNLRKKDKMEKMIKRHPKLYNLAKKVTKIK